MQRKSYFEPESLWRSSLHCRLIYTSKSRNNIDFIAFSQYLFSLGKQAIFQSTRFHGWSVINYIKAIFLIRVYIMSSLACNFHLFACCILPPPAIICYLLWLTHRKTSPLRMFVCSAVTSGKQNKYYNLSWTQYLERDYSGLARVHLTKKIWLEGMIWV